MAGPGREQGRYARRLDASPKFAGLVELAKCSKELVLHSEEDTGIVSKGPVLLLVRFGAAKGALCSRTALRSCSRSVEMWEFL